MTAAGDAGDFEGAADAGRRAAAMGLNTARFWSDFAIALNDVGDLRRAIEAAQRAVALDPHNHTLHFNLAQFLLADGQFERGWKEQEYRWGSQAFPSPARDFGKPMWDGSAGDKTVLLHAEQGFGDAIMFARYVPIAAQRARVIVECQAELVALMKTVRGADQVIARGDKLPAFDAHVPFLSVPMIFGTNSKSIPDDVPYLVADTQKVEAWRRRLDGEGLKVGIAWAGSAAHINDANRSMRFEQLGPLMEVRGVRLYSLQKGPRGADASGAQGLVDHTDELEDFTDTAALMENLDLVISVDTAIVHLAGALAKPVWTMLPFATDWRWLASHRDDSPWYPTMRLFRQARPRDWDGVVQGVAEALWERVGGRI
jgi:hypothetical protein